jgi:AAA15 family ATPase/GTPase
MLTKLIVKNFLSFKEETIFDFTATKYAILENTNVVDDVLKGALFIGPNASGKSNVLKAISILLDLLFEENPKNKFRNMCCFFSKEKQIILRYFFTIQNSQIEYHIEYFLENDSFQEKLIINGKNIIERIGSSGTIILQEPIQKEDLDKGKLFLRSAYFSMGNFTANQDLQNLIDFLQNSVFSDVHLMYSRSSVGYLKNAKDYFEKNDTEKINSFLKRLHMDFIIEYATSSEGEGFKIDVKNQEKRVFVKRKSFNFTMFLEGESLGNQIIINFLPAFLHVIENGGMLIVDEFSSGLHNDLEEFLVKYFMWYAKNAQLFFTSHSTNLLANHLLRPDQIYIIEFKDANGSTKSRISDFKPREAQNIEKMYLGGVFEGLPNYEELPN